MYAYGNCTHMRNHLHEQNSERCEIASAAVNTVNAYVCVRLFKTANVEWLQANVTIQKCIEWESNAVGRVWF